MSTYLLVVTSTKQPNTIVAGRMMSPLVLGVGEGGLLASDSAAIFRIYKQNDIPRE